MSQELSVNLKCLLLRNGIEFWMEKERADKLSILLDSKDCPQFINYDEEKINKSDITGIFSPVTIEDLRRRKNGQWQCKQTTWHERNTKCECVSKTVLIGREEFFLKNGYYPLN